MNRQPFIQAGVHYNHYDEDLDQREVLSNGVLLVFLIGKNVKKPKGPKSFKASFVTADQSGWVGHCTVHNGHNFIAWGLNKANRVEVRGLQTREEAIAIGRRIVEELHA